VSLVIFSVVPPTEPCALRSIQLLKVSTRDFSWGKGGRCVWLTTYHPCSAETPRKSGALIYPEPLGSLRPVAGDLYLYYASVPKQANAQVYLRWGTKEPLMFGDVYSQTEDSVRSTEMCELKRNKLDVTVHSYWVMWLRMNSRNTVRYSEEKHTELTNVKTPNEEVLECGLWLCTHAQWRHMPEANLKIN